jgi:hypothetical protein
MKSVIFYCCLAISLIGCAPENLFDLPTADPRITILSFNEVGQPWNVVVSPSTAGLEGFPRGINPEGLPDARVVIYEDGNFLELLTLDTLYPGRRPNPRPGTVPSIFRSRTSSPRPGHEYTVVVEAEGFPTATSTYIQPEAVAADITFEFRDRRFNPVHVSYGNGTTGIDTSYYTTFDISITFTDPPGENYYDFWITESDKESIADSETSTSSHLLIKGSVKYDGVILDGQMIDDQIISGDRATYNFYHAFSDYYLASFERPDPEWFNVALRTTTKDIYTYLIQTRKAQLAESDPYAQPFRTFTNVENGLGVFGGFTPYSKTFHYPSGE